ncbi:hypothetical protein HOLDEFILI_03409 [Holdemania filiformis DSM 12042]|uniref:Uncharacterized protein n=1 Tax=Holdemania filiformis DSM 12042 TaxID=545696 RepID=B9YC50_9FIRM|nr:hypothetical protein HOLDEFILI_03409 [Holdemania filiformis DSM 12042]
MQNMKKFKNGMQRFPAFRRFSVSDKFKLQTCNIYNVVPSIYSTPKINE